MTAWYDNCAAHNPKALQKVVRSAQRLTGGTLPALQDNYNTSCHRNAKKIIKDLSHPSHGLSFHYHLEDHQGPQPPELQPVHSITI